MKNLELLLKHLEEVLWCPRGPLSLSLELAVPVRATFHTPHLLSGASEGCGGQGVGGQAITHLLFNSGSVGAPKAAGPAAISGERSGFVGGTAPQSWTGSEQGRAGTGPWPHRLPGLSRQGRGAAGPLPSPRILKGDRRFCDSPGDSACVRNSVWLLAERGERLVGSGHTAADSKPTFSLRPPCPASSALLPEDSLSLTAVGAPAPFSVPCAHPCPRIPLPSSNRGKEQSLLCFLLPTKLLAGLSETFHSCSFVEHPP